MHQNSITRAFITMHLTVGLVILALSVAAAIDASGLRPGSLPNWPLFAFATLEAGAAVFFLHPRTTRYAGGLLLIILLTAFFAHAMHGDIQLALLVYSASTLFIVIHASVTGAFQQHAAL